MQPLLVNEVFPTVQGEGFFCGTPALFVRLQGCDVGCSFCDTGYALRVLPHLRLADNDERVFSKERAEPSYSAWDPQTLARRIDAARGVLDHVVLTGGEPLAQPVAPFMTELACRGFQVQVETSGTHPIPYLPPDFPCWITLSPKRVRLPLPENWQKANEIKIPLQTDEDARFYVDLLDKVLPDKKKRPVVCLQPVSRDPGATAICLRHCLAQNWRLSLQTHKFIELR